MIDRLAEAALLLGSLWAALENNYDVAAWLVAIACHNRISCTQRKNNG